MTSNTLLLSIQPRYTELILAGSKTIELRKQGPKLAKGSLVVMYASSPTCALVGAFVLNGVVHATPAELWRRHGDETGVARETFDRYYAERSEAFGLLVGKVMAFEESVSLTTLRQSWANFHPPQSYRYLRRTNMRNGLRLALPGKTSTLMAHFTY